MTKWGVDKREGLIVGIGLMVVIVLVDAGLVWLAVDRATEMGAITLGTYILGLAVLGSLVLLALINYWLVGLARAEYMLDRNALVIRWGPVGRVIPAGEIESVLYGEEVEGRIRMYTGGMWPGHCVGYGEIPGRGPVRFLGTESPRHMIYVFTSSLIYGISPADPETFFHSMVERIEMGPTQAVDGVARVPGFLRWTIWDDKLGLTLVTLAGVALLALIGVMCYWFPQLPLEMPLHFDSAGNPDRIGERLQVFVIPLIGLLALVANGVLGVLMHRRERMATYLLWGGAVLVQILVWTAALGLLGRV